MVVRTRHSRYHLVVVEPETGRVLISGGDRFPVPTEAQLVGATGGGSMLKPGWIGVGLRVELRQQARADNDVTSSTPLTIERSPHDAI